MLITFLFIAYTYYWPTYLQFNICYVRSTKHTIYTQTTPLEITIQASEFEVFKSSSILPCLFLMGSWFNLTFRSPPNLKREGGREVRTGFCVITVEPYLYVGIGRTGWHNTPVLHDCPIWQVHTKWSQDRVGQKRIFTFLAVWEATFEQKSKRKSKKKVRLFTM